MAKLDWHSSGSRVYEAGTDRGVLFLPGQPGVAWNGLISVSEKPSGGDPVPYYADGFKYLNLSSPEEFEVTITAFSAPPEFAECDGTFSIHNGLFVGQQPRKSFAFAYRTKVGNDTFGIDYGYKIHLVYNALAGPSEVSNKTLSDSPEPIEFSWDVTTSPIKLPGLKPSAHLVVDSRFTPSVIMAQLEGMLYGTSSNDPYIPSASDIYLLFDSYVTIELMKETSPGIFELVKTPAIRSATRPNPAPGQTVLWLDISAGYGKLTLVTGV